MPMSRIMSVKRSSQRFSFFNSGRIWIMCLFRKTNNYLHLLLFQLCNLVTELPCKTPLKTTDLLVSPQNRRTLVERMGENRGDDSSANNFKWVLALEAPRVNGTGYPIFIWLYACWFWFIFSKVCFTKFMCLQYL